MKKSGRILMLATVVGFGLLVFISPAHSESCCSGGFLSPPDPNCDPGDACGVKTCMPIPNTNSSTKRSQSGKKPCKVGGTGCTDISCAVYFYASNSTCSGDPTISDPFTRKTCGTDTGE